MAAGARRRRDSLRRRPIRERPPPPERPAPRGRLKANGRRMRRAGYGEGPSSHDAPGSARYDARWRAPRRNDAVRKGRLAKNGRAPAARRAPGSQSHPRRLDTLSKGRAGAGRIDPIAANRSRRMAPRVSALCGTLRSKHGPGNRDLGLPNRRGRHHFGTAATFGFGRLTIPIMPVHIDGGLHEAHPPGWPRRPAPAPPKVARTRPALCGCAHIAHGPYDRRLQARAHGQRRPKRGDGGSHSAGTRSRKDGSGRTAALRNGDRSLLRS